MTETQQDGTTPQAPVALQPLPGTPNLLDDAAAGCCGGGACAMPAPKRP